jgi:SAM-dependent methyltransferase
MSTISPAPELFAHAESAGIHRNVREHLARRTDLRGKKVIDLACGDGRTTHYLRELGAEVTPYDLFPESSKLPDRPAFVDLQAPLPIADASADLVVLQEVLEHLPNQLLALQEMHRILKPGGEVFLTTPSRSSLAAKFSNLAFESENMKIPPWSALNSVWGADTVQGHRVYYGHVWLVGIQQLRTMAKLAGFREVEIQRSEISRSSVFLALFLYLPLLAISGRATWRALRKTNDEAQRTEIREQFRANVSLRNLTNKFLIAVLRK